MPSGPTDENNDQGPAPDQIAANPAAALPDGDGLGDVAFTQSLPDVGNALEKAQIHNLYADMILRSVLAIAFAALFIFLNWKVMGLIESIYDSESHAATLAAASGKKLPTDQVVTAQVLMTLIGATAVQVGLAIAAIVSYLFPKGRSAE